MEVPPPLQENPETTMEIRLHGRGGQGGVTCAKILAAVYARLGKSVQTFGDYASERSGAPVRAYTRVSDAPIENRNKVYEPDEILVLDPTLVGREVLAGLRPNGLVLLNTPEPPEAFQELLAGHRVATVDATAIARRHGIGTRSVVIVNTTIAGAYVRIRELPPELLEEVYRSLGFWSNVAAAREAWEEVRIAELPGPKDGVALGDGEPPPPVEVLPLQELREGLPTGLQTGAWRTQMPVYAEHLAPCNAWCPAGNDCVGFIQAVVREGAEAASAVLAGSTPLAGVCGRVCPAPCMEGCNRAEYDGAVNIRALERWVADQARIARADDRPEGAGHRVAIVGSGPAGLAAAYHLARAGQKAILYEGEAQLGGVLRTGIPEYRLPRAVLDQEIQAVLDLGVEARTGCFLDAAGLEELAREHAAVILATGLQRLRGLEAPGVELPGIEQGIRFLHRVNLEGGGSLSGHVVVLGGGNTAMDCARSALRCGAERVTVAYRRSAREMPAIREEVEEAREEGVEFLFLRQPVAFAGQGRVEAVVLAEVELGEPDESGRRRPQVTDRSASMGCDHVLLALGQSPDLSLLPAGWELRDGRIHAAGRETMVFAAGDLATGDGTVTHAIGSGRRAAGRVLRALGLEVEVFSRPDRSQAVPATDIRFDHFAPAQPDQEQQRPVPERLRDFAEVHAGLADPMEAHRCFSCGHCTRCDTCLVYCPEGIIRRAPPSYEVDYSYCKGCGICVEECPRQAMEMQASCPSN